MKIQVSEDQFMEFDGEQLASASSKVDDRPRWMEVNIYSVEEGKRYIVQKIGRSDFPNERDYYSAHVADDASALIAALHSKRRGISFMPIVAEDAIRDAMERDPAIKDAWGTVTV